METNSHTDTRTHPHPYTRPLGRSGIEVSALGFGCWAIGGEWQDPDGQPLGWGKVDDEESVRAVRRALDLGVTFFDTADVYGTGHSERVLGRALGKPARRRGRRHQVGQPLRRGRPRTLDGQRRDPRPTSRRALDRVARPPRHRHVDLYQLHLSDADPSARPNSATPARIRTRRPRSARTRGAPTTRSAPPSSPRARTARPCSTGCNVLQDAPEMLALCEESRPREHQPQPPRHGPAHRQAHRRGRALDAGTSAARRRPGCRASRGRPAPTPEWLGRVEALRDILTERRPYARPGRLAWSVGPQPADRAHPRLPLGRPGRGERGRARERAAHRRARWPRIDRILRSGERPAYGTSRCRRPQPRAYCLPATRGCGCWLRFLAAVPAALLGERELPRLDGGQARAPAGRSTSRG